MPLQDQLDRITQNTRALVQPERLAISEAATAALFSTGIEDRILPVGATAPGFTLPDALTGKPVHLADVLSLGPVILNFFRGRWCPYCVTELEQWRDLHADLRRRGAFLLAISPQTPARTTSPSSSMGYPFPSSPTPEPRSPPNTAWPTPFPPSTGATIAPSWSTSLRQRRPQLRHRNRCKLDPAAARHLPHPSGRHHRLRRSARRLPRPPEPGDLFAALSPVP